MGVKLFGNLYDQSGPGYNRDVAVAWASGAVASSQGNWGLVTIPATASGLVSGVYPLPMTDAAPRIVQSGKKTITHFDKIYGSSLRCTELQLSSPSGFKILGSGSLGNQGCLYQANLVYNIPINNVNTIYISTSADKQDLNWTAFG